MPHFQTIRGLKKLQRKDGPLFFLARVYLQEKEFSSMEVEALETSILFTKTVEVNAIPCGEKKEIVMMASLQAPFFEDTARCESKAQF